VIRHTQAFGFRPDADPAGVESVLEQLRTFRQLYPEILDLTLGDVVPGPETTFSHVFSVAFAAAADLTDYLNSSTYEQFVQHHWNPVIDRSTTFTYEDGSVPMPTRQHGPFGFEYARIEVPDLAATVEFLQYHVGLQLEQHTDEYAYLRADIEHHCIELIAAPERQDGWTTAIGYSVESEEVLEQLHKRVLDAGLEVLELQERQKALCNNGFAVKDPNGIIVELFTEFHEYAEPPHIEIRPKDLVHPFLSTPKWEETKDFYMNVLGFLASDHVVGSTTFLRCEDRYHHSLAVQKNKEFFVGHLCFAMKSLDHVMRLRARALYKGAPIASDIVNHSASTSIAFYLHDTKFGPRFELCDAHRILTPVEHETHRARNMPADPRNIDVWRPAADDWGRF